MNFATEGTARSNYSGLPGRKLRLESDQLFRGTTEIVIVHQGEEYTLRITKNGKLILTK